jgi:hypothetical protein
VSTARPPASDSRKASNIQQGHQQQQQLTTRTLATVGWTAAETIGTSQTSATKRRIASAGMPAKVEVPRTILSPACSRDVNNNRDVRNSMDANTTYNFSLYVAKNSSEIFSFQSDRFQSDRQLSDYWKSKVACSIVEVR